MMLKTGPKSVQDLLALVDTKGWSAVEQRYASLNEQRGQAGDRSRMARLERNYAKYFDLEKWLHYHRRHVVALALDNAERAQRILDIGCGSGMFLFICHAHGHSGVGIDTDSPMYKDMAAALGVDYAVNMVMPFEKLAPDLTGFDLITAIATKFDRLDFANLEAKTWGINEWKFFFQDLSTRLNPGGRIYMKPNRGESGKYFDDPAIEEYFGKISEAKTDTNEFFISQDSLGRS